MRLAPAKPWFQPRTGTRPNSWRKSGACWCPSVIPRPSPARWWAYSPMRRAVLPVPNISEDYCTDDNARAFILAVLLDELEEQPARARTLATTYGAFLNHAFDPQKNRFHNHLSFDRHWLDEQGSEDSHAR